MIRCFTTIALSMAVAGSGEGPPSIASPVDPATAVARVVCGADPVAATFEGHSVPACAACPADLEERRRFQSADKPESNIPLGIFFGAFGAPDREEVIAVLKGCALSEFLDLTMHVRTMYLRKGVSGWETVASGMLALMGPLGRPCLPYHPSAGSDFLVCEGSGRGKYYVSSRLSVLRASGDVVYDGRGFKPTASTEETLATIDGHRRSRRGGRRLVPLAASPRAGSTIRA